jgi:hypothetical protein
VRTLQSIKKGIGLLDERRAALLEGDGFEPDALHGEYDEADEEVGAVEPARS